jgi:DNA-binding FadR family transcriptional regulator
MSTSTAQIDRATRNPVYGRVRAVLNDIPVSTRRRTDSVARAREIALAGHVEIFEAIAARNAAAARAQCAGTSCKRSR